MLGIFIHNCYRRFCQNADTRSNQLILLRIFFQRQKRLVFPCNQDVAGITVAMLSLLILIPLASVLAYSFRLSGAEFAELMMRPNVVQAFVTSIFTDRSNVSENSFKIVSSDGR